MGSTPISLLHFTKILLYQMSQEYSNDGKCIARPRRRQASLLVSGQPAKVTPRFDEEIAYETKDKLAGDLSKQESVFDVFDHRIPACLSLSNTPCSLFY